MVSIMQGFTKTWKQPANLITEARLFLSWVPAVLVLIAPNNPWLRWSAVVSFVVIALSDFVDGWMARRRHQESEMGAFLDATVDKVLVILTFVALSFIYPLLWIVTGIVVAREVAITILRFKANKRGISIGAIKIGKIKMWAQSIALWVLLVPLTGPWSMVQVTLVVAALILTIWSWIEYHHKFAGET